MKFRNWGMVDHKINSQLIFSNKNCTLLERWIKKLDLFECKGSLYCGNSLLTFSMTKTWTLKKKSVSVINKLVNS